MAGPTNAELTAQLTDLTKRLASAERRGEKLTGELKGERDRSAELAKSRQELAELVDQLRTELAAANRSLTAYKGSATKAKGEATVLRKQLSPDRRRIGTMKPTRSEEHTAARLEARDAAFAADTTELVFSDGSHEIRELAPLVVNGDAWRQGPHFRVLNHEPLLEPGDMSRESVTVRGIALLNAAGEQVDYCHLHEPVTVHRNQRVMLPHGSVRF